MRRAADTASRVLPTLLGAFVVSVVLGIVGMHALSMHGVMGISDHSAMTNPATSPVAGAHGDMLGASDVITTAGAADAGMSGTEPQKGEGHSLGSMVMLCFAMLAATAGALLLLLLSLRRRPSAWVHRVIVPVTVTKWVTAQLGTGPPYVWQFSVIRC